MISGVTTVEEIENAVAMLPLSDLAVFSAWFEAFEAEQFDKKIAGDADAGKLDGLAEAALAEYRAGQTRRI